LFMWFWLVGYLRQPTFHFGTAFGFPTQTLNLAALLVLWGVTLL
jgi:hypothetical protein